MIIDKKEDCGKLVIKLCEERLDAASAVSFKEELVREIEAGNTQIVLDLEDVSFIDSSGLGCLVAVLKAIGSQGKLSISGLHQKTEQIFKLTRMDSIFNIYPSVSEAVEAA